LKTGIYQICGDVDQEFDLCRLCIKVAATWEGLQACRLLAAKNIRTLATTCFTLEQAVLAAQVGCIYVSPFVHELKVFFEDEFVTGTPMLRGGH
jgi:transaldolase